MTLYEKNLKTLANYYPEMDILIEKAKNDIKYEVEIYKEQSLEGEEILKIKRGDTICYLDGRRNTKEPVQKWFESQGELITNAPVFMMGVGNSNYLSKLAEETKNHIAIVIYEPSLQIFLDFLETRDLEKWMKKHTIVFFVDGIEGMDRGSIPVITKKLLSFAMLPYARYFVLPNYDVLFPEEALEFLRICRKDAMAEVVIRNTKKIFSDVMVKNLFANAVYLCDGYKTTQLVDAVPRDVPGILVAAGPSLNKNIKELKKAQGKAFIVAVDTAVKPLLREGIKPDIIMIIDAIKPLALFETDGVQEIPFATTLNAASDVLSYHKGKKFFWNEGYQFAEEIFKKSRAKSGGVDSGGSVATNGFSLMHKLGLTRIILVGQDLAYTNNRTHADGTFQEKMDEVNTKGMYMVEGNYEEKVPTAVDLKQFLDWYGDAIKVIQEKIPEFHVINATEGGAKIANTEIMTLREAIERECKKEATIAENIGKLEPMLDAEAREWAVNYLKGIPKECQEMSAEARKMKALYKKLDKICRKRNLDSKEYLGLLKKIEKGILGIENLTMYQLANLTLSEADYIIHSEEFLHEKTIAAEGKEIARKGILYMDVVAACGEVFEKYAEEVFQNIE